ncbi:MAG: phosphate acyltransferase, partial [Terrimicrobiaceae bacterium]|nr:phosphate acyltransferase [Terrimicrobiaceae bacterium]
MSFLDSIFAKLKRHPKRIVFPDGEDPRIVRAAHIFYERDAGIPVLLGRREVIERVAAAENTSLDHVAIINPETASDLPLFCERLEKLERYKKMGLRDARAIMTNPNYFAAMMLQYGQVDGLVGGVASVSGSLLRPLIRLVKPLPHSPLVSGCMIADLGRREFGDEGVLFLADCGVVPDPDMQQLAAIAVQTALVARQVFGTRPRVAMLSFSTRGSARTPSTEKVAGAVVLARQLASQLDVEIAVDGEMQLDTALVPGLAERKMGPSLVAGRANVLIFPDLNSGNITAKAVQYLAGARVYGQIVLGLSRPAADLSRGATAEDAAAVAAVVGLQAIE